MADPRDNPDDRLPDPAPHCIVDTPTETAGARSADTPSEGAGPRNIDAPDLGGSFEENGQRRLHDGVGAGGGLEVLDEGLRAARESERNSSAGS